LRRTPTASERDRAKLSSTNNSTLISQLRGQATPECAIIEHRMRGELKMGLFGPKLSETDMFASAAMTYGQACGALAYLEPPLQVSDELLLWSDLHQTCRELSAPFGSSSHVMSMFEFHFSKGSSIPSRTAGAASDITKQAVAATSGLLFKRFSTPVSRDDAFPIGIDAAHRLIAQLPWHLMPHFAEPCGIVIGLAMKTIQDDTMRSGKTERHRRLDFGSQIGADWLFKSLSSH